MRRYKKDASMLRFATPDTMLFVLGAATLLISGVSYGLCELSNRIGNNYILDMLTNFFHSAFVILLIGGIAVMSVAAIAHAVLPDSRKIRQMIEKGLFDSSYGNPLHLKEGELLPTVRCQKVGNGQFEITTTAASVTVEDLANVSSSIGSSLNKKRYNRFAVVETNTDIAKNEVRFLIDDVTVDKSLIINDVAELTPEDPTKLIVQKGTFIDLTTSGSMLVAGKTRSGKTTGIVSLLMQNLLGGRDEYGSQILIIDPKKAELSRLNFVVTLDDDGEASAILGAIKDFADLVLKRQKILNDLSDVKGDAVKWWEAGLSVSLLFIDEYIALRGLLPKRATKDDFGYYLETFDNMIKRIITTGASAGCYVILSVAEASVDSGGVPALVRSACSTKILFRPTLPEARLMWDSEKLKDFPERTYKPGDCWFSSTDGVHDKVTYAHFPIMRFPVYRELGQLLIAYYTGQ